MSQSTTLIMRDRIRLSLMFKCIKKLSRSFQLLSYKFKLIFHHNFLLDKIFSRRNLLREHSSFNDNV